MKRFDDVTSVLTMHVSIRKKLKLNRFERHVCNVIAIPLAESSVIIHGSSSHDLHHFMKPDVIEEFPQVIEGYVYRQISFGITQNICLFL